jgi:hypothetical protein
MKKTTFDNLFGVQHTLLASPTGLLANQIATNLQVIFFTFVLFWKVKISSACIAPHKGYVQKEFEG